MEKLSSITIVSVFLATQLALGGDPLTPEGLVDKSLIARQNADRIIGTFEDGRPNIRPGTVLSKAVRDPVLSQVNSDALRDRLIAMVEERQADWSTDGYYEPTREPKSKAATKVEDRGKSGDKQNFVLLLLSIVAVGFLIYRWQ